MTQPRDDAAVERSTAGPVEPALPARPGPSPEPPPPGGRSELALPRAQGAVARVAGAPPVTTPVPVPAARVGHSLPGVQLAQRSRRRGDAFGWPANAAPGKPEGEVDTRP